jgi:hypothetical protein
MQWIADRAGASVTARAYVGLFLLLLQSGPASSETVGGISLSVLAGGAVSLSSETDTALTPMARIQVDGPFALSDWSSLKGPRVYTHADLSALPGESLEATTPETWRALRLEVGLYQWIGGLQAGAQRITTSVFVEGRFWTRLPGDRAPRIKTARSVCGGLRFDERTLGSFLQLGLCTDQAVSRDETYQPVLGISGAVTLWEADEKSTAPKASVRLVGTALLGLDWSVRYPGRDGGKGDLVLVGLAVGR